MKPVRTSRIARFHHEGELHANTELTLSKSASHHLVTVLRTREGDVIELFNGDGYNYRASVQQTGARTPGKRAVLQVHEATPALTESPVNINLVQGISRGDRMDITMRQSVELGVNQVQPLYTRHSAKALDEKRTAKKQEHWQSILVSASEQSGRARVPELQAAVSLEQWLGNLSRTDGSGVQQATAQAVYVLDPTAKCSLAEQLRSHRAIRSSSDSDTASTSPYSHAGDALPHSNNTIITVVIGPESGLDADEIQSAVDSGAQAVTIGPRILRTETAGPACITLIQAILGDLL